MRPHRGMRRKVPEDVGEQSDKTYLRGRPKLTFLLSPTAVSHHIRKCPLYTVPNEERRIAQERLWPIKDETTFADTLYHTRWF